MKYMFFCIITFFSCSAMEKQKSFSYPTPETDERMKQLLKNSIAQKLKILLDEHPDEDWELISRDEYTTMVRFISSGDGILPSSWCSHVQVDDNRTIFLPALAARRSCQSLFEVLFSLFHADYSFDPAQKDADESTLTDIVIRQADTELSPRIMRIYTALDGYCKEYNAHYANR